MLLFLSVGRRINDWVKWRGSNQANVSCPFPHSTALRTIPIIYFFNYLGCNTDFFFAQTPIFLTQQPTGTVRPLSPLITKLSNYILAPSILLLCGDLIFRHSSRVCSQHYIATVPSKLHPFHIRLTELIKIRAEKGKCKKNDLFLI